MSGAYAMYEREEKCIDGFGEETWNEETTLKIWT